MEETLVKASDLSLTDSSFNEKQLQLILKKTPAKYIRNRPAKGGGTWDYVSGGYVKKVLNLMFGFDWDFEILEQLIMSGEAIVKGKLTIRTNGQTITKMQFGNKDIVCKKGTDIPLSIGNDLKAASTDCLKKCAAEIGIAADIYNKEEFREVIIEIPSDSFEDLKELFELKSDSLSVEDLKHAQRIIETKEQNSYKKLHEQLMNA